MSDLENEAVVRRYAEAFSRGDTDALRLLFTDDAQVYDAQVYGALGWGGLDEVVPIWRMLHEAFAFQLEVEEIIAQGETVVARFVEHGTSRGAFRGQAPTGKSSKVVAIEWFTFRDGRIQRRWGVRDSASHFRQMGLSLGV